MQILRIKDLMKKLSVSRSLLVKMRKDPTFPKPVQLGEKAVGWDEEKIDEWLSNREGQSRG